MLSKTDIVKIKTRNIILLVVFLLLAAMTLQADGAPARRPDKHSAKEHQVKAAFIYNFMKFIEWPKETTGKDDNAKKFRKPKKGDDKKDVPIVIGMVGENPFGKAFNPILKKTINDRKLLIREFEGLEEYKARAKSKAEYKKEYMTKYGKALKKCHVLFFRMTEDDDCYDIVEMVSDSSVLTVGETGNFTDKGGVISFVLKEKKVRFEINLAAAKRAKLEISSKLLRLASRVIKEKKASTVNGKKDSMGASSENKG